MPIFYRWYFTVGRYRCSGRAAAKYSNWTMYFSHYRPTNPNVLANGWRSKFKLMSILILIYSIVRVLTYGGRDCSDRRNSARKSEAQLREMSHSRQRAQCRWSGQSYYFVVEFVDMSAHELFDFTNWKNRVGLMDANGTFSVYLYESWTVNREHWTVARGISAGCLTLCVCLWQRPEMKVKQRTNTC